MAWKVEREFEKEGFLVTIKGRVEPSRRNRHGSLEYIVELARDGRQMGFRRVSQDKWLGHCYGQVIIREMVEAAEAQLKEEAQAQEPVSFEVREEGASVTLDLRPDGDVEMSVGVINDSAVELCFVELAPEISKSLGEALIRFASLGPKQ